MLWYFSAIFETVIAAASIDMKYLFFDTETTGLPKKWKSPVTDLNNWPRLVQLAYVLCDDNGVKQIEENHIIKPEGFIIPEQASAIHGISGERALKEGKPLLSVLTSFAALIQQSDILVAHNMSFDEKIVGAEFLRNSQADHTNKKRKLCTMQSTTDFCAIPGYYGYKWPTLQELHKKLFGSGFEDGHDAHIDVLITVKCFFELKQLGRI